MKESEKEFTVGKSAKICFACGEKLDSNVENKCPYCDTEIKSADNEFNP